MGQEVLLEKGLGLEVRDVHHTHYGRLCPIETPEGPNIGLISSLATYAVVNRLGFLESPYRVVENTSKKSVITDQVDYLAPDDEDRVFIAQATESVSKDFFENEFVRARKGDDFPVVESGDVSYMDISPNQIVSVSASLIPFLEHVMLTEL